MKHYPQNNGSKTPLLFHIGQSLKYKINAKFTADSSGIKHKIDSLHKLNLPTDKYSYKLDSIKQKKDELVSEVDNERNELHSKTKGRLDKWKANVKSKVGLDSLSISSGINISDPNLPRLLNASTSIEDLPSTDLNSLGIPDMPSLDTKDFQAVDLSPDLSEFNKSLSIYKFDGLSAEGDKDF